MEADLTDAAKVQGAVRWEKYSDFGSTVTGKLAGSYRVAPAAAPWFLKIRIYRKRRSFLRSMMRSR